MYKDIAGNRYVVRHFHYIRQWTVSKEHKFQWISSKFQLADILTKVGNKSSCSHPLVTLGHQFYIKKICQYTSI